MRAFSTNRFRSFLRSVGLALAAGAMFASAAAGAAGFSLGVGAGADRGRVDCAASLPCDHSGGYAKLFVGYQLGDTIDLQAVYFDGGHFNGGDTTPLGTEFGGDFKVNGFGLTAGYRWEFAPSWSLSARAGIASVRTRFGYASPFSGSASQTHGQPLVGLGISHAIAPNWRLALDYDVTRFKVHTTYGPLQMLGLSTQFSF